MRVIFDIPTFTPFWSRPSTFHHISINATKPLSEEPNTALTIFGTTQFIEARNSNYHGFKTKDLEVKAYTILQRQAYMLMRWCIIRYSIECLVNINLIQPAIYKLTPDNFLPSLEEVKAYIDNPKFLWRFSLHNYYEFIKLFQPHDRAIKLLNLIMSFNDGSGIVPFARAKHTKLINSFKEKFQVRDITMSHFSLHKIDDMNKTCFKFQLNEYETIEYLYSDDFMLFQMDGITTYEEFTHLLIAGQCLRYNSKILESKVELDKRNHGNRKLISLAKKREKIKDLRNVFKKSNNCKKSKHRIIGDSTTIEPYQKDDEKLSILSKLNQLLKDARGINFPELNKMIEKIEVTPYSFYGEFRKELAFISKFAIRKFVEDQRSKTIITNRLYLMSTWSHAAMMVESNHPHSFYKFLYTYVSFQCSSDYTKMFHDAGDPIRYGWSFPKLSVDFDVVQKYYTKLIPQEYLVDCYRHRLKTKKWKSVMNRFSDAIKVEFRDQLGLKAVRITPEEVERDVLVENMFVEIVGKRMKEVIQSINDECFTNYEANTVDQIRIRVSTSKILEATVMKLVSVTPQEVQFNLVIPRGDFPSGNTTKLVPNSNTSPMKGKSEGPVTRDVLSKMIKMVEKFENLLEILIERHINSSKALNIPDKYELVDYNQVLKSASEYLANVSLENRCDPPKECKALKKIGCIKNKLVRTYDHIAELRNNDVPKHVKKEFKRYFKVVVPFAYTAVETNNCRESDPINYDRFGKVVGLTLKSTKNSCMDNQVVIAENSEPISSPISNVDEASPTVSTSVFTSAVPSDVPSGVPSGVPTISTSISSDGSKSIPQSVSFADSESVSKSVSPARSKSVSKSVSFADSESVSKSVSPARSKSIPQSVSFADSESVSKSVSPARSKSVSKSVSFADSESVSKSVSVADSESVSKSVSPARSKSVSKSVSFADSESVSKSVSFADSESVSKSVLFADSKSIPQSVSPARSKSVSKSVSPARSKSIPQSVSPARSKSVSKSVSFADSESVSKSVSPARSKSVSKSVSFADSESVSKSVLFADSESVSKSVSPARSKSIPQSVSPARSKSVSKSVSFADSESVSKSVSPARSKSIPQSVSFADSESVSTSVYKSVSVDSSMSLSPVVSKAGIPYVSTCDTRYDTASDAVSFATSVSASTTPPITLPVAPPVSIPTDAETNHSVPCSRSLVLENTLVNLHRAAFSDDSNSDELIVDTFENPECDVPNEFTFSHERLLDSELDTFGPLYHVRNVQMFERMVKYDNRGNYDEFVDAMVIPDFHDDSYFDLVLELCEPGSAKQFLQKKIQIDEVKIKPFNLSHIYFIRQLEDKFKKNYHKIISAIKNVWQFLTYTKLMTIDITYDRLLRPFDKCMKIIPFEYYFYDPCIEMFEGIGSYLELYDLKHGVGDLFSGSYQELVFKIQRYSDYHSLFIHAWAKDRHLKELWYAYSYCSMYKFHHTTLGEFNNKLKWPEHATYDLCNEQLHQNLELKRIVPVLFTENPESSSSE